MTQHDETLLTAAIDALKATEPDSAQFTNSAQRVAARLGLDESRQVAGFSMNQTIETCDDVQHLLTSYKAGTLTPARTLLVEAHLRDCRSCLRQFKGQAAQAALDWTTPKPAARSTWHPRSLGWAMAASIAMLACSFFLYKAYWQVPAGVRAEVQSIDGAAYRTSDAGDRQLAAGDSLSEGDHLRTAAGAHAVIRLSDGSTVEVDERSVLGVGARGKNMTVSLDNGAVIVQAAKRRSGHLYLKTQDCRVAVTGTVFSVDAGIKGSRVAVLQGSVHVAHAGIDSLLHAGDQITTSDNLSPAPFEQQIGWSHDRDKYLPLLAEFATLRNRIGAVPFPQPRYTSDLLARMPADTVLYVSIPNLGDFLSEANNIVHDQLKQSPELQQWWAQGKGHNTEELDAVVDKLHDMSRYLGDEIVIVSSKQPDNAGFAVIADVHKSGLGAFLNQQFSSSNAAGALTVFDQQSLGTAKDGGSEHHGAYALIREHEAVFTNSIGTLKQMNAQLNAGASGFATGDFGKQITAAYSRGAGVILAADLHQMIGKGMGKFHANHQSADATKASGLDGVEYLIAEHRETNGSPENHLNLQFAGTRQRIASWLGAPAPIGSLDFVSPNAAVAVAVLSKDPKSIADDLMAMADQNGKTQDKGWSEAESKLQISVRDDLAANLGGDFSLSLDGPVLPTPSWKAVIEVYDAERLEQTLERLTQTIRNQSHGKDAHSIAIEPSQVGAQRYYSVHDLTSGATVAQYTFSGGYMIIAPNRALLIDALKTQATGNSLAHAQAFRSLLPHDDNENYSAIAYQNLGPVLTPLLSQFSGPSADALRQLAADSRPTAICAWGRDNRIEAASDSRLFGFDFLTLGALMNSRNNNVGRSVRE